MNWGVDEELVTANPGAGYKKATSPRRRELHLSEGDLRTFWQALCQPIVPGKETSITAAAAPAMNMTRLALKLVIILGQREEEVAGLPVSELHDLDGASPMWKLPAGRSKNKLPHQLPLPPLAVKVIKEAVALGRGSPWVFVNDASSNAITGPALRRAMQRMCKRLGIAGEGGKVNDAGELVQHPSPHDLRRTVGTLMRKAGVDTEIRAHIFNHVGGAKSKVTSWNYDAGEHNDEKLGGLLKWEARLLAIVSAQSNVVPFKVA